MSDGSTLLVAPLPPNDIVGLIRTKAPSMKRRNFDIGIPSCPHRASDSPITTPCTKKLRRYVSEENRSSKVRWKTVLEDRCDANSLSSDDSQEENKEIASSEVTESETWYSKEQYKQMLLDQSLTVHIMRSLRSLAGEEVAIEYCHEIDSDTSRFDELIKKHQIDPEEYCERGLESYLSEERRNEINASRKLHKLLVIGEYVRQGMLGSSNPELVRNVSMNQSNKSLVRAQKLAMVDQRQSRSIANNDSNMDLKENTQRYQSQKQNAHAVVGKKTDRLFTNMPSSPSIGSKFIGKSIDPALWNLSRNSVEQSQPSNSHVISEGIRDDVMKQQLVQFLLEQERDRHQRAQSRCHPRYGNDSSPQIVSSVLASLQMQELDRLFHQNQQRQRLQIQHNYQTQVQRLLLLQQHQQQRHYESVQLATAAILEQQHHR